MFTWTLPSVKKLFKLTMNNNEKHIESLLNLFMQGETTLEQERELRQFFALSHEIPKEWEPYKEMMAYFDDGMPIATGPIPRRNISHPVWLSIAAAAVAAITIMVVPNFKRTPQTEVPIIQSPSITAVIDSVNVHDTIVTPVVAAPKPIVAKVEKRANIKEEASVKKQKPNDTSSTKRHFDPIEMEREQGEIELAQQELMADKFMIEQERQEILEEQYKGRAQAYQARQAIANENPQFIQVVFK